MPQQRLAGAVVEHHRDLLRVQLARAQRRQGAAGAGLTGQRDGGQVVAVTHRLAVAVALHGAVRTGGDKPAGLIEEGGAVLAVETARGHHMPMVLDVPSRRRVGLQAFVQRQAGRFDIQGPLLQRFGRQRAVVADFQGGFVCGRPIEAVGIGQGGIGIVGRQARHGHGALDQTVQRGRREFGYGNHGLLAADEDAQAQVVGFVALDRFQCAFADTHAQRAAFGEHRFGRIGAGAFGARNDVFQRRQAIFGSG